MLNEQFQLKISSENIVSDAEFPRVSQIFQERISNRRDVILGIGHTIFQMTDELIDENIKEELVGYLKKHYSDDYLFRISIAVPVQREDKTKAIWIDGEKLKKKMRKDENILYIIGNELCIVEIELKESSTRDTSQIRYFDSLVYMKIDPITGEFERSKLIKESKSAYVKKTREAMTLAMVDKLKPALRTNPLFLKSITKCTELLKFPKVKMDRKTTISDVVDLGEVEEIKEELIAVS